MTAGEGYPSNKPHPTNVRAELLGRVWDNWRSTPRWLRWLLARRNPRLVKVLDDIDADARSAGWW